MKNILLVFACFLVSMQCMAVSEKGVTGKITKILSSSVSRNPYNTESEGAFYIYIDGLPSACGTTQKRVVIGSNHPLFATVTSVALMAYSTELEVVLAYLESCTVHANSWDFSYMYIQK